MEQEEEFMTNRLTKRLDELRIEKEKLSRQVEKEEVMLTNTLQKKLDQVSTQSVKSFFITLLAAAAT